MRFNSDFDPAAEKARFFDELGVLGIRADAFCDIAKRLPPRTYAVHCSINEAFLSRVRTGVVELRLMEAEFLFCILDDLRHLQDRVGNLRINWRDSIDFVVNTIIRINDQKRCDAMRITQDDLDLLNKVSAGESPAKVAEGFGLSISELSARLGIVHEKFSDVVADLSKARQEQQTFEASKTLANQGRSPGESSRGPQESR